MSILKEEWV